MLNHFPGTVLMTVLFVLTVGCSSQEDTAPSTKEAEAGPELFSRLQPAETNIGFENELSEKPTPHRTELLYEYFSNGAGVAVGDLTGNGRPDIYFTANMGYNKLYLNQGELDFREVTTSAGVQGRKNTWNTGVTFVDVNGDGRLDIYVCYSGELPHDRRVDELYIHQGVDDQGIPYFEERASEYGLANPHSSNQAYFFDYDGDGDLDLYLQTHNVKTIPRGTNRSLKKRLAEDDSVNGNRFYENRGGTFMDVTDHVGIQSSPLTYGLGAVVTDVNKDGWPDIYVGNDYSPPDYLYLNNGDGTFTDVLGEQMGHISRASMGIDAADVNNDAYADIVVLDMIAPDNRRQKLLHIPNDREAFEANVASGFHHQYTINTLQRNNGNGTFSEIGQLAGISNTDWSWAPLIADYDNDGWKDLYVTNGIFHDITNRDFIEYRRQYIRKRNYDLQPADVGVLMKNMPSTVLENYAFENRGGKQFADATSKWGLDDAANSNGAAYADLDGDGDLDLVTNNINERAYVYENQVSRLTDRNYLKVDLEGADGNTDAIGAKVTLYSDSSQQYLEQAPTRGYLSSVGRVLHFGLGSTRQVDSVRVKWPDGQLQVRHDLRANQTVTLHQSRASEERPRARPDSTIFERESSPIDVQHRMEGDIDDFRRQPLMVNAKSFDGPALASADVNGDTLQDVFVGGGNGQVSRMYVQREDGTFDRQSQPAFAEHRASHDVQAVFFDYDGDGDRDLYVASGGYGTFDENDPALQDRLYVNEGAGSFAYAADALPRMRTSTGAVAAGDVNGDGRPDLFIGGRVVPGRYPEAPRSYVLVNTADNGFVDRTNTVGPDLTHAGMVTDALWQDVNGSGREELIVVGEWMPISVYQQVGEELIERTSQYFDTPHHGFWYSAEVFPLADDSTKWGLLAGNLGRNTQLQASKNEPIELFFDDFNQDRRLDPILSSYSNGERHPHVLLDRLREVVPALGARFSSYDEYAEATLGDLLTAEERRQANRLHVDRLETTLFVGGESQSFEPIPLPEEVQSSPIHAIEPVDYDGNRATDLLLAGNTNETRVRFPKYDANYGILLRGDGQGGFTYVPQVRSGFALRGDVRSIVSIQDRFFFGLNRDSIVAYRSSGSTRASGSPGPVRAQGPSQ